MTGTARAFGQLNDIRSWTLLVFLALSSLILSSTPSSAETISFDDNWGRSGYTLVNSDASGVEIVFSISELYLGDHEYDGHLYHTVDIPGLFLPNDEGAPDLPGTGRFIAIPHGAAADLTILDSRTETLHNIDLIPAPALPLRTDDSPPAYKKNLEIYERDAYYPDAPVRISSVQSLRGVDAVILGVTPFQYNPVTRDLIVYRDLRVRIDFQGGNSHFGEDRLRSRFWDPILRSNLLNHESLPKVDFDRTAAVTDEDNVEYLIIVPDDPAFIAWADTIKQWRNQQGIITGVTTIAEIGGNTASLIEDYIDNAYHAWEIPPVAVLLLSDYQDSGDRYGISSPSAGGTTVSDNIYADVNGDNLPDLAVSRICAQNAADLETMISKFITYESCPSTNPLFYDSPMYAAHWEADRWFILHPEILIGYLQQVHGKHPNRQYCGTTSPPPYWSTEPDTPLVLNYYGPHGLGYVPETPDYLTNWTGNTQGIIDAINAGCFIAHHCDHGSEAGWSMPSFEIPDLVNLTNTDLPFLFDDDCLSGKFTGSSACFAEEIHRMEGGALGLIAGAAVTYSFVSDVYFWGTYDGLFPDFDPYFGADLTGQNNLRTCFASVNGKYYLAQEYWPYWSSTKTQTYNVYHHHGDAFTTLYSEIPQELNVVHAGELTGGVSEFTVMADEGALIGLSVNGEWIGAAEGTGAPLIVNILPQVPGATMLVTVTKVNHYRYQSDVIVTAPSGPHVIAGEAEVVDGLGWNPNGQLDYDETSRLTLTVQNIGIEDAEEVTVTISSEDTLLTIIDGSEYYGTVPADSFKTVSEGFEIAASPFLLDEYIFFITVQAVSSTAQWQSAFGLTGHAPVLTVDQFTFRDPAGNNNGWLDPGETADMDILISNGGSSPAQAVEGLLTSLDPLLIVNNAQGSYGDIASGVTATATYTVTADPATPQEHIADAELVLSGSHELEEALSLEVIVGNVQYDPTGPDNYGYLAYDPHDTPELPVYDWVEICADSGGPGTLVNFTESEQVFPYLLPFSFQYYGVPYDTFTVAGNGWVGMGRITEDDYSNSGIPQNDGPPNMIAPYWEDLSPQRTNSGKVWRYYDENQHRLIVEYNHVEQYAPLGEFETFQVILYDPEYYPTLSGDGRILFQYKEMSSTAINTEGTIGIENATETDGIQYFFDGNYDTHAHHLENEFAILFTTVVTAPDIDLVLYPYGAPIQIPATGGSFDYNLAVENLSGSLLTVDFWCDVTLPDSSIYGPLLGPLTFTLPAGFANDRDRSQSVPENAPAGIYHYNAYAGNYPNTIFTTDSFTFTKLTTGNGPQVADWSNTGEAFDEWFMSESEAYLPDAFRLHKPYPNPFNPTTTISFEIPVAGLVKLEVFDVNGRRVEALRDAPLQPGVHHINFNKANRSSGIYFVRLQAGEFQQTQKLVLLK